jgi:predicted HTH domain antitoxin
MTEVKIPVAENILVSLNMDAEELVSSMCKEFALKPFRDGKLTLAQGAAFCGMNIYDFISAASQAGIPIIDYSIEDVEQELVQFV